MGSRGINVFFFIGVAGPVVFFGAKFLLTSGGFNVT